MVLFGLVRVTLRERSDRGGELLAPTAVPGEEGGWNERAWACAIVAPHSPPYSVRSSRVIVSISAEPFMSRSCRT